MGGSQAVQTSTFTPSTKLVGSDGSENNNDDCGTAVSGGSTLMLTGGATPLVQAAVAVGTMPAPFPQNVWYVPQASAIAAELRTSRDIKSQRPIGEKAAAAAE